MEFWPGNQGQSPLYSTFTLPGRNCTQIYHDRHQAARNPLYYSERPEQRREPSYWTLPGPRAAAQDYATWTEQEPIGLSPSHFPFILDRHPQHHQDLGAYQPHEARDREWSQRASREYERAYPREGWPRRWETCNPARYGREAPTKRSDSSYRELEAWAARYSHSLQRRRRIEAELRGASQGLAESARAPERDIRGGTAALQQVAHPGLCDRAGRQQGHPPQSAPADAGHPPKEKTCYQRRLFSQPPGYIAPPPYDTPQKSPCASQQGDTSWEQEGKKQTYWTQPAPRKQDTAVDPRSRKTEEFPKPDANPHAFCSQYSRPEPVSLPGSAGGYEERPHVQFEGTLSLQRSPLPHAAQSEAEEASSTVIEGRKFKLNRKAGGMTVFCLVSRIAEAAEVPPPPACALQVRLRGTEGGEEPKAPGESRVGQAQKVADEVDCRAPALPGQPGPPSTGDTSKEREPETRATPEDPETDVREEKADEVGGTAGTQAAESAKPSSLKYPLWREPSFPVRPEHATSSTCPRATSEEGEPEGPHSKGASAETPSGVRAGGEGEEREGPPAADAACFVVKLERIPPPKKERVHYFDSAPHPEDGGDVQPAGSGEEEPDPRLDGEANAEHDPDAPDGAEPGRRPGPDPCATSSVSDRETLAERAERILGIPLDESVGERGPQGAVAPPNGEEDASLAAKGRDGEASVEDRTEEEPPRGPPEFEPNGILPETDEAKGQVDDKGWEDSEESPGEIPTTACPEAPDRASGENDDSKIEKDGVGDANEQMEGESPQVEDDAPHLSPSTDSWPSPDILPSPVPASVLENRESKRDDLELTAPISAAGVVAPPPIGAEASPHPQEPQSAAGRELETQTQTVSGVVDLGEDGRTSQPTDAEVSEGPEDVPKDGTKETLLQRHDEVGEAAEEDGVRETTPDRERQAEEEEVLVDSGVEETEVSQNLFQDDIVCTEESPRTEDTEEGHTEQLHTHEEPIKDSTLPCLEPAGTFTDDTAPLKEVETGLSEARDDNAQLSPSQEISILQPNDAEEDSNQKDLSDEPSEAGAPEEPAGLPEQEMVKEDPPEAHTDTETQQELEAAPPPDVDVHTPPELPAPSQAPRGSEGEVVSSVTMDSPSDAADAVTIETAAAPLHQASRGESETLSSSSDTLPGLPSSSSPLPLQEGKESVPIEWPPGEEPQYPKSLWDAVNRIRKHTAPDSENEEEEVGEMWDPENVVEEPGGPHGAQEPMAKEEEKEEEEEEEQEEEEEEEQEEQEEKEEEGEEEVPAEESITDEGAERTQQEPGDVEEGPLSCSSTSGHSPGEMVTDGEDHGDTPSESATEVRTLKDEELQTAATAAAAEQSCSAEDEDEERGQQ